MLGMGSVLLSLFPEAVKASFGGAKHPIPGGILREKSLLPAPCSRRWEMLSSRNRSPAQQCLRMAAVETASTEGREGTCFSLGGEGSC